MPPKTAPGKNVPTKNPPPRGPQAKSAPTRGVKKAGKKAKEKQKGRRLKLKGWLETKADWVKFDAWAQINAQPRKIPEPEPVVRASKPLSKMKKRIAILSTPHKQPDISKTCRTDLGVSKKALTAKPSKRILELAMFVVKNIEPCREFPIKISRAALRYKATKRIKEISRPHFHFSEYCKLLATSQEERNQSKETSARTKRLALAKKAIECPNLMTDEEINILMTPTGIYRSALNYKFTPWMAYLALPSYRFLKEQTDEQAEEWKRFILEESETRGKKALEYKKKKEEEKAKRREDDVKKFEEKKEADKINEDVEPMDAEQDKKEDTEETNKTADATEDNAQDSTTNDEKNNEESVLATQKIEADESTTEEKKSGEDEEAAKRRKAERNAWRFAPSPFKDDPFEIKRSALNGKVSPRMDELAKPHVHKDRSCRVNPFEVRKSALDGPIPERMAELAKPNNPRDPVERPPPREKDAFGRPIFKMPSYGKKMPRVKPYQEAECPDKNEKTDTDEGEKMKNNEGKKRRIIDPIVYEATIDPCIDPERAKRQLKARKAAKEEIERNKKTEEATGKNNESQERETTD